MYFFSSSLANTMPRCNLCLKNNAIRHCPVFVAKSIEARRECITKWDYCLNCLAYTHSRSACCRCAYSSSALLTAPPYWNHMIPPLVRVNLMHKGNPMWVNLLLDPKSDCSYLIRSVANLFPDFTP